MENMSHMLRMKMPDDMRHKLEKFTSAWEARIDDETRERKKEMQWLRKEVGDRNSAELKDRRLLKESTDKQNKVFQNLERSITELSEETRKHTESTANSSATTGRVRKGGVGKQMSWSSVVSKWEQEQTDAPSA